MKALVVRVRKLEQLPDLVVILATETLLIELAAVEVHPAGKFEARQDPILRVHVYFFVLMTGLPVEPPVAALCVLLAAF